MRVRRQLWRLGPSNTNSAPVGVCKYLYSILYKYDNRLSVCAGSKESARGRP